MRQCTGPAGLACIAAHAAFLLLSVMGMGTAASRRSEADHIAAIEDSFLSLAALPAPAPADQLISQQSLSSDTPVGMEQYLQRVVEATRYRGRMKWAGAREAAPSPALQSEEAPEVTRTAVLDFTESSDENETSIGSGTLNFFARNGSLLSQMPYSAPLVARSTLERALLLMKLTAAGAASTEFVNRTLPTEELFAARLLKYGIQDLVGNIKQVSGEVAGLPGYSAWLTACLYGVPVHSYAWILTFKDDPDAAAFIFIPTDFSVPTPLVDDFCIAPRPLNDSAAYPCPPYNGWPCLVTQGFQLAFDVLRDQLLPAWQEIKSKDAPALPKRILCGGHSLGGATAALCATFMKAAVPSADVTFFGMGTPPTGNEAFVRHVLASTVRSTSILNKSDPVPGVFLFAGYAEIPELIWLVSTGTAPNSSVVAFVGAQPPGLYLNAILLRHVHGFRRIRVKRYVSVTSCMIWKDGGMKAFAKKAPFHCETDGGAQATLMFDHETSAYLAALDSAISHAPV